MNDKHQEIAAPRVPLILTMPAYNFVVALHLDYLGPPNRAACSGETFEEEVEKVDSSRRPGRRSATRQGPPRGRAVSCADPEFVGPDFSHISGSR